MLQRVHFAVVKDHRHCTRHESASLVLTIWSSATETLTSIEKSVSAGVHGVKTRLLECITFGILQELQTCKNAVKWTPQLVRY